MAKDFFIPKLGDNVDKVTIVNWLVEDGAQVQDGDEIVEVETDKAVVPIPANGQGYLHIGPYKAGDVVPIMTVIATISEKEETSAPGETGGGHSGRKRKRRGGGPDRRSSPNPSAPLPRMAATYRRRGRRKYSPKSYPGSPKNGRRHRC
jgi:pyruvate/2-oxoglutarate dehydrogenase complex dihydrolipoamide acyltransferase (E2) component